MGGKVGSRFSRKTRQKGKVPVQNKVTPSNISGVILSQSDAMGSNRTAVPMDELKLRHKLCDYRQRHRRQQTENTCSKTLQQQE